MATLPAHQQLLRSGVDFTLTRTKLIRRRRWVAFLSALTNDGALRLKNRWANSSVESAAELLTLIGVCASLTTAQVVTKRFRFAIFKHQGPPVCASPRRSSFCKNPGHAVVLNIISTAAVRAIVPARVPFLVDPGLRHPAPTTQLPPSLDAPRVEDCHFSACTSCSHGSLTIPSSLRRPTRPQQLNLS